ncbi:hypothetical protein BGY98DRAFT_931488 [Russula aff. rugulosa BPL654]|nr:hypothetical protein BGY98DRAFT_931488 [Russula aff. rugulosa BPL654]
MGLYDEPLRVRERELDRHGDMSSTYQQLDGDEYPRVGIAPTSRHATLTEASTESDAHRSRSASHVDAGDESSSPHSFGRDDPPVPLNRKPDEEWLNARGPRSGAHNGSGTATPLRYLTPEPRRADSGHEIPLFAGTGGSLAVWVFHCTAHAQVPFFLQRWLPGEMEWLDIDNWGITSSGESSGVAPTVLGNSMLYPSWVLVFVFGKVEMRYAGDTVMRGKGGCFAGEGGGDGNYLHAAANQPPVRLGYGHATGGMPLRFRYRMGSCRVPASLAGPLLASWRNDHATQNQTKETLIDTTSTTAGAAALRSSVLGVKLTPAPDIYVPAKQITVRSERCDQNRGSAINIIYISITPHIASTGTMLAAQHHVHVKKRNGTARRLESFQS